MTNNLPPENQKTGLPMPAKVGLFGCLGCLGVAIVGFGAIFALAFLISSNAPYRVLCDGYQAGFTDRQEADNAYTEQVTEGAKNCRKEYKN